MLCSFSETLKYICISTIFQHSDGAGSCNYSSRKIMNDLFILHCLKTICHRKTQGHQQPWNWLRFTQYWGFSPRIVTWWRPQMKTFSALLGFCEGIHRSLLDSPHKGQSRGALKFSLICAWTNGWANNRETGDLRRNRAHHDVTVMANWNEPGRWNIARIECTFYNVSTFGNSVPLVEPSSWVWQDNFLSTWIVPKCYISVLFAYLMK